MTALKERGHNISFCALPDEYSARLAAMGFNFIPIDIDRKGTSYCKDLCLIFRLYNIYRRNTPNLVLHNSIKLNIYGTIAARFSGTRCVNTVSGLGYIFIKKNRHLNLVKNLYRVACKWSEMTFFQNKEDLQYFLDHRLIKASKCSLIAGSGVNTDFFKPGRSKQAGLNDGVFIFLYLGRILWDKGIGELIESAKILKNRYPSMRLNFLGMIDKGNPMGIRLSQVQEWEKEGLINYLGETDDVRSSLERCDCIILPSYREGIPKALLEASAMELPVIATDVPGCRDVVEHEITGILVEAKSVSNLANAMEKMINMTQSERQELGMRGRRKMIEEYSEKKVIETYCTQLGI
jgi:glycosyltransferase involved in cell wall biosynthesis